MKAYRILLIISIVIVSLGGLFIIVGSILTLTGNSSLGDLFMGLSSLLGLAALVLMVIRLFIMAKTPHEFREENPRVVVKVVDVKEIPKTKEEQLYEQYEDLYKKNLITKEDLDLKRKELLGK